MQLKLVSEFKILPKSKLPVAGSGSMDFDVYRMRINPNGAENDANPLEFCKDEKIVGLGHEIYTDRTYDTFDEVKDAHREYEKEHYDNWMRFNNDDETLYHELRYILDEINIGDYVWVNRKNDFYLCQITSGWRVAANVPEENRDDFLRNDIHNFRRAEWKEVDFEDVPGFIRRQFSTNFGSLTGMPSLDNSQQKVVEQLFEGTYERRVDTEKIKKQIRSTDPQKILDSLGPVEMEDLVLLYLQSKNWKIVGSSMSMNQAEIECELRRGEETGLVQVKSGKASVDPSKFTDYTGSVLLFVGADLNLESYPSISQIPPKDVAEYLLTNIEEVPREILSEITF